VEPAPVARAAYLDAGTPVAATVCLTGNKPLAARFLQQLQRIAALTAPEDELSRGHAKGIEAQYRLLLDYDPWQAMLVGHEGAKKLEEGGDQRILCQFRRFTAQALQEMGQREEAELLLREILRLATKLNEPFNLLYARAYLARLLAAHPAPAQREEA